MTATGSGSRDALYIGAAVAAASAAFQAWSAIEAGERAAALRRIADGLEARTAELAETTAREVGTPLAAADRVQVGLGVAVLRSMADAVEQLPAEERLGSSLVLRVAAGVVGAITPWNYPLYQLAAKVAPALGAGCTCVVKPSSVAPLVAVVPVADADDAVRVANDSDHGLSGAVWAGTLEGAMAVARRLRTGQVAVDGGRFNVLAPFGGFKKSGVGRELGPLGLAEYFELVSLQLPATP